MIPNSTLKNQKHPNEYQSSEIDDLLRNKAFESSLQPNIISTVSTGEIIIANKAACKLLGYSKKQLLTKNRADIFDITESSYKKMIKQRMADGNSTAMVICIKNSGKSFRCEITTAIFKDESGIKKAVFTISDMSQSIRKQMDIDSKKARVVADDIDVAKSKQRAIDSKKAKIVAHDIIVARARQRKLDAQNEKKVADNIIMAQEKFDKQIAVAAEDAKDMERSDLGRELHDNVNQLLSVSKLYQDMAKNGGENTNLFLTRSTEYTIAAIEEIRKLTKVLTTDFIQNFGLSQAINDVTRDAMEVSSVKIYTALDCFVENSVNDKFKLNVYRILQEQLNNILKHSKATEVTISLSQDKNCTLLTISDDGIGFDTRVKQKGIGINNIKSRVSFYRGTAIFASKPGKGCLLTVRFPFPVEVY